MTNSQLHHKLARVVRDLDDISGELMDRAVPDSEANRASLAQAAIGQLCMLFLDSKQLKPLSHRGISDVYRRMTYSTTDENYISVADRVDADGQAAGQILERMFSIKKPRKTGDVIPIKARKKRRAALAC